jgi:hypothetical protein
MVSLTVSSPASIVSSPALVPSPAGNLTPSQLSLEPSQQMELAGQSSSSLQDIPKTTAGFVGAASLEAPAADASVSTWSRGVRPHPVANGGSTGTSATSGIGNTDQMPANVFDMVAP